MSYRPTSLTAAGLAATAALASGLPAAAQPRVEMNQVLVGSLDQPQVRAILRDADGNPLSAPGLDLEGFGERTYTIDAYYDTGAGTVLLGPSTAASYGMALEPGTTFTDVGVAGSAEFDVSTAYTFQLTDFDDSAFATLDNPATFDQVYTQRFDGVRAAIGPRTDTPPGGVIDPIDQIIAGLNEFNVIGTPLMDNKLAVFDNRGINTSFQAPGDDPRAIREFLDLVNLEDETALVNFQMKTRVYDSPNTPGASGPAANQPAIPTFDARIRTDYADFDRLTTTTGGPPPALAHNPFIGPAPSVADEDPNDGGQNLPGVTLTQGGVTTESSWLFDTGAAASILSEDLAAQHGVFYSSAAGKGLGSNNPTLVDAAGNELGSDDLPQFQLQIGGVGGTVNIAGFFIEELILPGLRPDGNGGEQAFDIAFAYAPVLVADITVDATPDDLTDDETFTLEGVLGMNLFAPSLYLSSLGLDPTTLLGGLPVINSNFDQFAFDEPTGDVLLQFNRNVVSNFAIPEPTTALLLTGLSLTLLRRRPA